MGVVCLPSLVGALGGAELDTRQGSIGLPEQGAEE